jgi:hypothetical protein
MDTDVHDGNFRDTGFPADFVLGQEDGDAAGGDTEPLTKFGSGVVLPADLGASIYS